MTNHQHQQDNTSGEHAPWYRNRITLGLVGFLAVAGYFLISEHQAHFIASLPYLLLLACPLMHVFMHGGHGNHHGHENRGGETRQKAAKENHHA